MHRHSFRDPAGRLYRTPDGIFRVIYSSGAEEFEAFLATPTAVAGMDAGQLVGTDVLDDAERDRWLQDNVVSAETLPAPVSAVARHRSIPFPSYPYEWSPRMLRAAAMATLDLAERAINDGFQLKDATPFNVLFDGPRPVFIDLLSFEKRDAQSPIWRAEGQFRRTFLLPLLAAERLALPLQDVFQTHRDGLYPEQLYGMCSVWQRWGTSFFWNVTLPHLIGRRSSGSAPPATPRYSEDKATFVLLNLIRRLRRQIARVQVEAPRETRWSDYETSNTYSSEGNKKKHDFVRSGVQSVDAARVLDIGCNTGEYSLIAADCGAEVVAVDTDTESVSRLWDRASEQKLPILPLVQNIAWPSPAVGWRYGECDSFLSRAEGQFDMVLMLALIHHLMIREGVPLDLIVDLAAGLTRNSAIVEYVSRDDDMFRAMAQTHGLSFDDFDEQAFERAFEKRFTIVDRCVVEDGRRTLYLLRLNG